MGFGVRRLGLAATLALAGCSSPPPPTPSAVIRACPGAVCAGDGFTTTIHLDATKSTSHLTLVPAAPDPPRTIKWSFAGSEMHFVQGAASDPELFVSMKADRPLHVTLRVDNSEGGVAEETKSIAITPLDADGNCPLPEIAKDFTGDCLAIGNDGGVTE